ncbi:MAG: hypothetical protein M1370_12170 [Bacteroidetes bacterium]|nr:hypothetical protein [Bacteroidota bacterium]MCL5026922.1 hypothetical protein [Chloroflexota bacterium]
MTGRRAVLAAMDGQIPQRTPVAVFSGGAWSVAAAGETFPHLAGDARRIADVFAAGQRLTESDMVFTGSSFNNYMVSAFGAELLAEGAGAPSVRQPIVAGPSGLERLSLAVIGRDPVLQSLRQATLFLLDEIGDATAVTLNSWAPFTLAGQFCGLERLMTASVEEEDFAGALVDACAGLIIAHADPVLAAGRLEVVSLSDPTASGNLIPRRTYERMALPATRRIVDLASSYGARTFLHVCGRTLDRLDLMVATGAACLSLDAVVDLADARRRVGPRVCLAGNVDPLGVMAEGTPEDVRIAARAAIAAGAGGPFILAPGCDLPPAVPLANIRALVETARSTFHHSLP